MALAKDDDCGSNIDIIVCVWGHVNDGNAHINIVTPAQHVRNGTIAAIVEEIVYDSVDDGVDQYRRNMVLVRVRIRQWDGLRNAIL